MAHKASDRILDLHNFGEFGGVNREYDQMLYVPLL